MAGAAPDSERRDLANFVAEAKRLYLHPRGIVRGAVAAEALNRGVAIDAGRRDEAATLVEIGVRLACGTVARKLFPACELFDAVDETEPDSLLRQAHDRLRGRSDGWAGFALARPLVMGIVNVTPDSFADGGKLVDPARAVEHGRRLMAMGADLVDVGGESTRPGADPVEPTVEQERVLPVVSALAESGIPVSIDTRHPATMGAALAAGAIIINDVNALRSPDALKTVASTDAAVILMHMRGEPKSMQRAPYYENVVFEVFDFLDGRVAACIDAGIARSRIMIDTGIGFGKTAVHNCALIGAQRLFRGLGTGVLLGASRKGFISSVAGDAAPDARLGGSIAAILLAGADMVRVHDVAETVQALRISEAIS